MSRKGESADTSISELQAFMWDKHFGNKLHPEIISRVLNELHETKRRAGCIGGNEPATEPVLTHAFSQMTQTLLGAIKADKEMDPKVRTELETEIRNRFVSNR